MSRYRSRESYSGHVQVTSLLSDCPLNYAASACATKAIANRRAGRK